MDWIKSKAAWIGVIIVTALVLMGMTLYSSKGHAADKGGPKPAPASDNIFADAPVAKVSWTGVYIGAAAGYSAANAEISYGPLNLNGLSATGPMGALAVGGDIQIPGSMLVLGARAGYSWEKTEFSLTSGPSALKASIDDGWTADGRIGLALGTALPYVFAGYTQMHTSASLTGAPSISSSDLKGWRTGAGVEFRLPKTGLSGVTPTLALEYIHTDFNDLPLLAAWPTGPNVNVTENAFLARLNVRFGDGYAR